MTSGINPGKRKAHTKTESAKNFWADQKSLNSDTQIYFKNHV